MNTITHVHDYNKPVTIKIECIATEPGRTQNYTVYNVRHIKIDSTSGVTLVCITYGTETLPHQLLHRSYAFPADCIVTITPDAQ